MRELDRPHRSHPFPMAIVLLELHLARVEELEFAR